MKARHLPLLLAMTFSVHMASSQSFIYIDTHQGRPLAQSQAIQTVKAHLQTTLEQDSTPPLVFLANGVQPILARTSEQIEQLTDSLELYHLRISDSSKNLKSAITWLNTIGHPLPAYRNQTYFLFEPEYSLKDQLIRPMMVISDGMKNACDILPSHAISYRVWDGSAFTSTTLKSLCDDE